MTVAPDDLEVLAALVPVQGSFDQHDAPRRLTSEVSQAFGVPVAEMAGRLQRLEAAGLIRSTHVGGAVFWQVRQRGRETVAAANVAVPLPSVLPGPAEGGADA